MADSSQRKKIEEILQSTISKAQPSVQSDPKLGKMIEKIRILYHEDQEDFLFALGAPSPSGATRKRNKVPLSRIPQLLFLLNAVTTRGTVTVPPSFRNKTGVLPSSLQQSTLEVLSNPTDSAPQRRIIPISPARQRSHLNELEEIEKMASQIQDAKQQFEEIKKEESAILNRKGKYAITIERLKAERLLRELPGTITQLAYKKRLLEEKVHGSNLNPGESN